MRQQKTEASVFRICAAADGWTVIELYYRKSVANFAARDDALEYAISLAQRQRDAVVELYAEGGLLEARSEYAFATGDVDRK